MKREMPVRRGGRLIRRGVRLVRRGGRLVRIEQDQKGWKRKLCR
jgi:hypothetical protein